MKAVGLITEYNPFHNGHLFHLREALRISKADVAIAVMSGDFVQRGEPAIIDKYARSQAAIDCGVNLVVELPAYYALSSAEGFADGAVRTLAALLADSLVFGSECADLSALSQIAKLLVAEPEDFRAHLRNALAGGYSFPQAKETAIAACLGSDMAKLVQMPNNTLGIEYLKALERRRFSIRPYTISRTGAGYNDHAIHDSQPSAAALRDLIVNSGCNNLSAWMPDAMTAHFFNQYNNTFPVTSEDFTTLLNYRLSQIFYECDAQKELICRKLCSYPDISADLANRITQLFNGTRALSAFACALKTRQYTATRINRCLMHIILDITNIQKNKFDGAGVPYLRILGFDSTGQKYLNHIKKKCSVPIVTKTADYKALLREDIHAASIYNQIIFDKYKTVPKDEFRHSIYIKRA